MFPRDLLLFIFSYIPYFSRFVSRIVSKYWLHCLEDKFILPTLKAQYELEFEDEKIMNCILCFNQLLISRCKFMGLYYLYSLALFPSSAVKDFHPNEILYPGHLAELKVQKKSFREPIIQEMDNQTIGILYSCENEVATLKIYTIHQETQKWTEVSREILFSTSLSSIQHFSYQQKTKLLIIVSSQDPNRIRLHLYSYLSSTQEVRSLVTKNLRVRPEFKTQCCSVDIKINSTTKEVDCLFLMIINDKFPIIYKISFSKEEFYDEKKTTILNPDPKLFDKVGLLTWISCEEKSHSFLLFNQKVNQIFFGEHIHSFTLTCDGKLFHIFPFSGNKIKVFESGLRIPEIGPVSQWKFSRNLKDKSTMEVFCKNTVISAFYVYKLN